MTKSFVQNQQPLYVFVRNLVGGDAEEARDIVQETFTDAWRAALRRQPPFVGTATEADMRRWLFHVVYQRAISVRRHRRVLAWESLDQDDFLEPAPHLPESSFEERMAAGDALRRALDQLDASDVACIILKTVHGFSSPEMAQILELSPEAVRKRFSRAIRRLRTMYHAQDDLQRDPQAEPEGRI